MKYSPIILFAFNRLDALKNTVRSLQSNAESTESDLIVFVDGAREHKEGEKEKVQAVQEYIKSITGFKTVTYNFSEKNKGLAPSIISGVTEVLEQYGRAIVLEDDLYLSPSFLNYMNTMLDVYEKDERIMQISGYSTKIRNARQYHCDHYLSRRSHSWSWATWKDRWEIIDWEVRDYEELMSNKEFQKAFCEYGSDLIRMLKAWKIGLNNSWFVRFNYSMHKQGRFSVCPIRSLVRNDGFGLEATHCNAYNRYKIDFIDSYKTEWIIPEHIEWNEKLGKESVRFWSIPYRIYGKLMTYITYVIG